MGQVKSFFMSNLQWFRDQKQNYLAKSPLEKWSFIRDFCMSIAKYFGCNFVDDNFKITLRSWFPALILVDFFICAIYALYHFRYDPTFALVAISPAALIVPSSIVWVLIINSTSRKRIQHLFTFGGDFIYANSNSSPKNHYICDQMSIHLLTHTVRIILLLIFSLNLTACVPFHNILFKSDASFENQIIMINVIPFTDPFTQVGFYINWANQGLICLIGVILLPLIELMDCVMINNISVSAAVIANTLTEFVGIMERKNQESAECTWKFRNIIVQIMDYDSYVIHYVDTFYWKFLIQPILLMYSTIYAIFTYFAVNIHYTPHLWIILCICRTKFMYIIHVHLIYEKTDLSASLGYSICCYTLILILCDAGKSIDDANDTILDALNQFPFYLLSTKKQKMFALLMKRNQSEAKLKIGPFAELNYVTATKLTKTIYTYTMFMFRARG